MKEGRNVKSSKAKRGGGLILRDVVYTVADRSDNNYMELKHSLRSLEQYGKKYGNVIIVMDELPDWINSETIIHIKTADKYYKARNIITKLLSVESDVFTHFNDDYFLTKNWDLSKDYNYIRKGAVMTGIVNPDAYQKIIVQTGDKLIEMGYDYPLYFDQHFPFTFNRELLHKAAALFNWADHNKLGYLIRSMYGNTQDIKGRVKEDCKVNKFINFEAGVEFVKRGSMFSSGHILDDNAIKVIKSLYPTESRYEIT